MSLPMVHDKILQLLSLMLIILTHERESENKANHEGGFFFFPYLKEQSIT